MTEKEVLDIHLLERRKYNLLLEVLDLSKQIGAGIDRNDQTAVRALFGLRQEPITSLEKIKAEVSDKLKALDPASASHMRQVLAGKTSSNPAEERLMQQASSTEELLNQVLTIDQRINKRIAGEDSVYAKKAQ